MTRSVDVDVAATVGRSRSVTGSADVVAQARPERRVGRTRTAQQHRRADGAGGHGHRVGGHDGRRRRAGRRSPGSPVALDRHRRRARCGRTTPSR